MREYFMKSERLGFSLWQEEDLEAAKLLWGESDVTRYICGPGVFTSDEIADRLALEIRNGREFHIQYWPVFFLETGELAGCCGLRPCREEAGAYEMGVHFRKKFWGQGYALEAARRVIEYAFCSVNAKKLFAGHHPENLRSSSLLKKLGFTYLEDEYYEPTGLMHPSYVMENPANDICRPT